MKNLLFLIVILLTSSVLANSAMVFPKRAMLDSHNRYATFTVYNPSDRDVQYNISFVDRLQTEDGMTHSTESFSYSAQKNLRYSPRKKVMVKSRGKKTIRVKLTKLGQLTDGEYRSYLNIRAADRAQSSQEGDVKHSAVSMSFQIPVLLRKGKTHAAAELGEITQAGNALLIELKKQGNRSIYGNIIITQDDEVIASVKSIAVYAESEKRTINLPIKEGVILKNFTVEFIEDESSGKIKASKTITI
ncbi:hypothetical protein CJF42_24035 [Pseudoalteromonas sp. NBT06-2]|uniref:hypothetical protein n=1 Tax=Pseudoalteromonas sp. NBT06-2 TaxID=2025950 RepID=UPI000BA53DEB|nr:hypothetical protein [Pseudoalteromonas sp. NBT06-2]PAJ71934.1 hypothetical protein CJF42_24035 [Pseudoalteromonas sp. NBT06-2]